MPSHSGKGEEEALGTRHWALAEEEREEDAGVDSGAESAAQVLADESVALVAAAS